MIFDRVMESGNTGSSDLGPIGAEKGKELFGVVWMRRKNRRRNSQIRENFPPQLSIMKMFLQLHVH